jgi:S1-C subfamily serine protease
MTTERNLVTPNSSRIPFVLAGLVAALGLGAGAGAATYAALGERSAAPEVATVTEPEPASSAAAEGLSAAEIYERAHRGVVEITVSGGGRSGQGSGFVYDAQGHVVTNEHVVAGGGSIDVRFADGSSYPATLLGTDRSTDLAVIDVDAPASVLVPLRLGDSAAVSPGDGVVALGSPFGLEGSITSGIVSALHRQMEAGNGFTITDSIQTDAAINHGNSGGPLLDASGRVIGVNAQIRSDSGGSDGVGFAIPSNTVRTVVTQILETGRAEHAYVGVGGLVTVDAGVAFGTVADGTPADKAGLRPGTGSELEGGLEVPTGGDVIVEFDGEEISTTAELQSAVDGKRPGDTVSITVLRDGERKDIEVTLGTRPA